MHAARRDLVRKRHGAIESLEQPDPRTATVAVAVATTHLVVAVWAGTLQSWTGYLLTAWLVGGTCAQHLFLATHELTHNLVFAGGDLWNNLMAIALNTVVPIPYAMTFRKYHAWHHTHLSIDDRDPDLPTAVEARVFGGTLGKLAFCAAQGLLYAVRPLVVRPLPPTPWEVVNGLAVLVADAVLVRTFGWGALGYLLLSIVLGTGIHPLSSHHLTEHFVFERTPVRETYSRYFAGSHPVWDTLTVGVDRHVEHHDFPKVPWRRLSELRRAAPTLYPDPVFEYTPWIEWISATGNFVLGGNTLFDRVKRRRNPNPKTAARPTE